MPTPYQEPILVSTFMYPVRSTNRVFNYLSGIWGFKAIIAPLAASYALALGVEAVYLSIPSAFDAAGYSTTLATEDAKRSMRFVPKIGIDDGAKLTRVLPLRQVGNLVNDRTFLPRWVTDRAVPQEKNIWDHPALFLFAFGVSASIQYYERQLQAPTKLRDKRAKFIDSNNQKRVTADPQAIPVTRLHAARVNAHGTGAVAANALCVALVYGLEFAAFLSSFKSSAAGFPIVALYCAYTIFGFELFMQTDNEILTSSPSKSNAPSKSSTNGAGSRPANSGKPVSGSRPAS